MGVQGKLTKDKMGWAMPVDAPAYGPPPGYFKQARFIRFDYETDAESASEIIPEQLTLTDPATAAVMFVEYPWSTAGYYREAFLGVNVTYNDEKLFYACYLMLTKAGFGGKCRHRVVRLFRRPVRLRYFRGWHSRPESVLPRYQRAGL